MASPPSDLDEQMRLATQLRWHMVALIVVPLLGFFWLIWGPWPWCWAGLAVMALFIPILQRGDRVHTALGEALGITDDG